MDDEDPTATPAPEGGEATEGMETPAVPEEEGTSTEEAQA